MEKSSSGDVRELRGRIARRRNVEIGAVLIVFDL
jgi:hypothetical protein